MTTLRPGDTLAHYEITAKLGEGGMGEVFRARDARLGRDVALKILPAVVGADAERLERFRREAQAVAALNNPNIVTLYSIEEAGDVRFLTMEVVEGEPLESAIPEGGLAFESWLEIGLSLADAVAAAHAKGIVHRDLKPASIMVGERARIKVLDFGLAKIAGPDLGELDAAFALLDRADRERQPFVLFTGFPTFDPLRGDPRFAALERRLNLVPVD